MEVADQCTRELRQHNDDSVKARDQCDTAEDQLEKSDGGKQMVVSQQKWRL